MACTGVNNDRVVALVDMDCFYVQVEERDYPAIRGRPAAVVQYNTHRGGGIIAVNYEARACGVKRGMRGTDASDVCPGISLIRVPMLRNKANLQKYRNAGKEVLSVLCGYSDLVERASIDEAYLDLTRVVDDKIEQWRQYQAVGCVGGPTIGLGGEGVEDAASDHGDGEVTVNQFPGQSVIAQKDFDHTERSVKYDDHGDGEVSANQVPGQKDFDHTERNVKNDDDGDGEVTVNQVPGQSVTAQKDFDHTEHNVKNNGVEPVETSAGQGGCVDTQNNRSVRDGSRLLEGKVELSSSLFEEETKSTDSNVQIEKQLKSPFRRSVQALIPTMDELKSTWVKLPDDQSLQELQSEYDLSDTEQRKKYELNETFLSKWSPQTEGEEETKQGPSKQKVEQESEELDEGEAANKEAGVPSNNKTKAATNAETEAERVGGLTRWLNSIREDYKLHSSSSSGEKGESSSFSSKVEGNFSTRLFESSVTAPLTQMSNRRGSFSSRGSAGASIADLRLAIAARLCEEMREAVLNETGFKCSAGIAHNKVLAKLVCGLHKPNQQTVIPSGGVAALWRDTSIHKVRNLGGKLGESLVSDFGCKTMAELSKLSLAQLQGRFDDKTALWLHGLGRGHDSEAVVSRQLPKSVGCSKNFLGRESLYTRARVEEWTRALAEELAERLQEDMDMNKRVSRSLTVGVRQGHPQGSEAFSYGTRCCSLASYAPDRIAAAALTVLEAGNTAKQRDLWSPPILNISLSAGKFEDSLTSGMPSISDMFKRVVQKQADQANASAGEGSSRDGEASTSRNVLTVTQATNGSVRVTETTDDMPTDNDAGSSSRMKLTDSGPAGRQKGSILAYLTEKQSRSLRETSTVAILSEDSDPDDPGEANEKKHEKDSNPGNSFFKRFIMKKMSSINEQGTSGGGVKNNNTTKNASAYDDEEDSCDAAINLLVDQLDADSDDEEGSFRRDLEVNPICKVKSIPSASDAETTQEDIYNDSTDSDEGKSIKLTEACKAKSLKVGSGALAVEDEHNGSDHKSESTRKTVPDQAANGGDWTRRMTASTSVTNEKDAKAVSVSELFPDLDSVDESLLPLLPAVLRRAVAQALEKRKADLARKEALQKTGLWRYMKKDEGLSERRSKECYESKRGEVEKDIEMIKGRAGVNTPSSSKRGNIEKFMTKQVPNGEREAKSLSTKNFSENTSCSETRNSNKQSAVNIIPPGCSINLSKLNKARDNSSAPTICEKQTDIVKNHKETNVGTSKSNPEETIDCDRCGAPIPLTDIEEHLDYHVALDIQKQFGGGSSTSALQDRGARAACGSNASSDTKSSTPLTWQAKPGKRKLSTKTTTPEAKKNRTLETFFKK